MYKIILLGENKDGFYKAFFNVLLFVGLQLVVRKPLLCYPCKSAIFMPRKKVLPRTSFRLFVQLLFLKTLILSQVISMEQLGVVAAETISILSMKCSLTVSCPRRQAPHHCGDPDPSRTMGQTSVDSSNHLAPNVSGK